MSLKVLGNFVSVHNKVFFENQTLFKPPANFLNNLLNPRMNNVEAIDYANKDWIDDSDYILARWT